ncbi:cupin domain-containing protein [bacterium]|nr:cupin domain-containing protein [bacterium]
MSTVFAQKVLNLKSSIEYQENSIVSKTITENKDSSLTLFALDNGQSIAAHSAPVDAVIQVLEGILEVMIDEKYYTLNEGEIILMPKNLPHALNTKSKVKMALFKV